MTDVKIYISWDEGFIPELVNKDQQHEDELDLTEEEFEQVKKDLECFNRTIEFLFEKMGNTK